MRKPSSLSPWFTVEQLVSWVKEAPDKTAYQRRLAIWLTHAGPFAAHRVADLLTVSTQAVWKWVAEYNTLGPAGLDRKGRGGRRWGLMTLDEKRAFLAEHLAQAESGDLLTVKQLAAALAKKLGQEVSIDYIYSLLHRHQWRKLTPRPHHAKQDPAIMEAFKKKLPHTLKTIAKSLPAGTRMILRSGLTVVQMLIWTAASIARSVIIGWPPNVALRSE